MHVWIKHELRIAYYIMSPKERKILEKIEAHIFSWGP
jgi:hypothetical protein